MKNLLLMLFLVALTTGCGNESSKKEVSEKVVNNLTIPISPTEELKAIGNIHFFISEKEFLKEKEVFLQSVHNSETDEPYSTALEYKLGEYEFLRLDGHFNNDSLFYISLIGYVYRDNFNPEFKNRYDALYSLLTTKYGEPSETAELPSAASLISSKEMISSLWKLGNKNIIIKTQYYNGAYFVNMEVFRMDIITSLNQNRDSKKEEKNLKDVEKI